MPTDYPYVYAWGNNDVRAALKGRPCRIVAMGKRNTVDLEFEDGIRIITSRRALRRRAELREGSK